MLSRQEEHYYRDGDLLVRMAMWDKALSNRHRTWGSRIQCTDLDQIVTRYQYKEDAGMTAIESMNGRGYAIIEYKHVNELNGDWRRKRRNQIETLQWNAGMCKVPLFYCFYERQHWSMYVVPMNEDAKRWAKYFKADEDGKLINEAEWVHWQHRMRGITPPRPCRLLRKYNSIILAKTWKMVL